MTDINDLGSSSEGPLEVYGAKREALDEQAIDAAAIELQHLTGSVHSQNGNAWTAELSDYERIIYRNQARAIIAAYLAALQHKDEQ